MMTEKSNFKLVADRNCKNPLNTAVETHQQTLKQAQEQSKAPYDLGMLAQQKKDYQTAEYWLLEALRVQPDSAQIWFSLGNLYQIQEKLLEAAEAYWQAMSLRPDSAPIFNNLGYILERLERWDEAVLCYQKALELQPNLLETEVNLGNVLHTTGKLSDEQQAHLATLNYQLGVTRYQYDDFKAAQLYFRQVIALQPDLPDTYAYLGMALAHQEKLEEAFACCHKAVKIDPNHELANKCIKHLEEQRFFKVKSADEVIKNEIFNDQNENSMEASEDIRPNIEIKSDIEILGKISGAIWHWAKTGFSIADQSTYEKRYSICMQCPRLADAPRKLLYKVITANSVDEKICTLCGCVVSKKARIASESCPDKHSEHPELSRWEEPLN